jgi:hypothetical protein
MFRRDNGKANTNGGINDININQPWHKKLHNHLLEWLSRAACSQNPLVFVVVSHCDNDGAQRPFVDDLRGHVESFFNQVRVNFGGFFCCGLADVKSVSKQILDFSKQWLTNTRRRFPFFVKKDGHVDEVDESPSDGPGEAEHENEQSRQHLFRSFVAALFLARVSLFVLQIHNSCC